jgi:hypothetical protein
VDQNLNNNQNEFLWTLLANPANDAHLYNYNLQRLVNDFPQSGILQALLAHSSDQKNLRQASVYFNAKSLYKLINAPSSFIGVADEKIIVQNNILSARFNAYQHQLTDTDNAENYFSDHAAVETDTAPVTDHQPETEHEAAPVTDEHHITEPAAEVLNNLPVEEHHADEPVESHEHQAINDIPVEEHHAEEHIASYEHQAINEIPVEEHHADEHVESHEHQPINEIPVEEHHSEEHVATIEHQPINEIPVEEHHSEEHVASNGHQAINDIPVEEHHAEEHIESNGHQAINEIPVEEHHAEETHEEVAMEHSTDGAEHVVEEPAAETHENWLTEIKDEVVNEMPAAEPVINYAQGLGHKMAPEGEIEEVPVEPASAEIAHEAATTTHDETVHEASAEYPVENNITEEQTTQSPVPQEPAFDHSGFTEPAVHEHMQEEEQPVQAAPVAEHNNTAWPGYEHREITAHVEEIHQPEAKSEDTGHNIEEETFDEITGIENIDIEKDIIGNIAATDFFTFDRAFGAHKEPEPVNEITEPINSAENDGDQQDVSKYHDEKLPYSFLWWLDKTRKEHSGVYQPYVAPEKDNEPLARAKPGTDELQQQYYENIFHITSVEELDKSVPQPPYSAFGYEPKRKEQVIIERFIQEEPQIRPQSSDKLDNENKAKKSSEDRDELVSETLAAIYSDQMLYHKAIASYKKLMLRFPEKSRYFAEKIEQLEKKTN